MVPEPAESHTLPGVQPLQVADHQDSAGPAAARHAGPLPLQHAGLPCQEAAGGLRGCWEDREGGGQHDIWMDGWMGKGERRRGKMLACVCKPESVCEVSLTGREEKALWKSNFIIFSSQIHSDRYKQLATFRLRSAEREAETT